MSYQCKPGDAAWGINPCLWPRRSREGGIHDLGGLVSNHPRTGVKLKYQIALKRGGSVDKQVMSLILWHENIRTRGRVLCYSWYSDANTELAPPFEGIQDLGHVPGGLQACVCRRVGQECHSHEGHNRQESEGDVFSGAVNEEIAAW